MRINFDFEQIDVTEFGVGRDFGNGDEPDFTFVPVDVGVQNALCAMAQLTWRFMQDAGDPQLYEPSDKHGSVEYLYLPLDNEMATSLRDLHQAVNLPIYGGVMNYPKDMFCYFARLTDKHQNKLTGLHRASYFKGILKQKGHLIRFLDDTMQIVEDNIFKLDNDFDLLIDDTAVHILRPSGFEFAGKLQQAILDAVKENVVAITSELPFVKFDGIEVYASSRPRAARYLASIRGQGKMKDIDKSALKKLCKRTGVEISESKGSMIIAEGNEMAFLQVLDRRRYHLELVEGMPEKFVAASRSPL